MRLLTGRQPPPTTTTTTTTLPLLRALWILRPQGTLLQTDSMRKHLCANAVLFSLFLPSTCFIICRPCCAVLVGFGDTQLSISVSGLVWMAILQYSNQQPAPCSRLVGWLVGLAGLINYLTRQPLDFGKNDTTCFIYIPFFHPFIHSVICLLQLVYRGSFGGGSDLLMPSHPIPSHPMPCNPMQSHAIQSNPIQFNFTHLTQH